MSENKTSQSKGELIIGDVNPSDHPSIVSIKITAANLINVIDDEIPDGRRKSVAITHIEQASMMAVKALFQPG